MNIINRHTGNPNFTYEGNFGPSVPLTDPEITIQLSLNNQSKPVMLHVTTKISGNYDDDKKFAYEIEENIEIDPQDQALNSQELLKEMVASSHRCFDKAHAACIDNELSFPFPRTYPGLDEEKLLALIEKEL